MIILLLALGSHAFLTGLAIGSIEKISWGFFFSIGLHKFLESFAFGSQVLLAKLTFKYRSLLSGFFSSITPLGVFTSLFFLTTNKNDQDGINSAFSAVCESVASGTFLFVAINETIIPALSNGQDHNHAQIHKDERNVSLVKIKPINCIGSDDDQVKSKTCSRKRYKDRIALEFQDDSENCDENVHTECLPINAIQDGCNSESQALCTKNEQVILEHSSNSIQNTGTLENSSQSGFLFKLVMIWFGFSCITLLSAFGADS